MSTKTRYISPFVLKDLAEKLVFLGGPRQVGKTTLALNLLKGNKDHPAYLNWDVPRGRFMILKGEIPPKQSLIVLDEIHKFPRWRGLMKGLFDEYVPKIQFLVTGSARLNIYRRGGDSLQGRYHYFNLHPLSLNELSANSSQEDLTTLLRFGGFPEPYFRQSETFWRRWHRERQQQIFQEDVRNLEQVKDLVAMELLWEALLVRVGAPLSIKSIREDLSVAHDTVERWLQILEKLYVIYRIAPFGAPKIRAVKKEKKLYFWDWSQVKEPGAQFENLVASQLLKYCDFLSDTEGYDMELRYLRDTDLREIDFVVLKDKVPQFAVECKTGERHVSKHIHYFRERTKIPYFYQVHMGRKDFLGGAPNVRVLPFVTFCRELGLP